MGDKCERQVWETSGRPVYNHAAQGTKSGRQVRETSVGDKCKLMRPKAPRVGDKCGRQGGDKCKLMRPKEPRVADKCGRQVWEASVEDKCGRQVWETSGRQE